MDAYGAVAQSVNFALKKSGFPAREFPAIKRAVGWGDAHLLEGFVGKKALPQVLRIYRKHHAGVLHRRVRLIAGAFLALKALRRDGYCLAVASNRPKKYSLIALRALGIHPFFDVIVCGDEVPRGKPAPDILRRILEKCSVKPRQALYVGDMGIDIQAGRRASIRTVAVLSGSGGRQDLLALKPWKLIRSVKGLPQLLLAGR